MTIWRMLDMHGSLTPTKLAEILGLARGTVDVNVNRDEFKGGTWQLGAEIRNELPDDALVVSLANQRVGYLADPLSFPHNTFAARSWPWRRHPLK